MAAFCTNCGMPLTDGASFCVGCGAQIISGIAIPVPASAPEPVCNLPPEPAAPETEPAYPEPAYEEPAYSEPAYEEPAYQEPAYSEPEPAYKEPAYAEPEPVQAAAEIPAAPQETGKKGKKREKKQKKQKGASAEQQPGVRKPTGLTVGSVILLACIAAEFLPYLLKAVLFLILKGPFSNAYSILLDVFGFAAAGLILFLGGKRISGEARLSPSILFPAVWGAMRIADTLLMNGFSIWEGKKTVIFMAVDVVQFLFFTACAVTPLNDIFSGKGKCRRRGVLLSYLLVILAALVPYFLPLFAELTPAKNAHSFFASCSFRLLTVFLEAGLLTLAANHQLKRLGEEKTLLNGKVLTPSGVFGTGIAALTIAGCFFGNGLYSVPDTVLKDAEFYLIKGEEAAAGSDVNQLLRSYRQAAAHCDAWLSVSSGGGCSVPAEFTEDRVLQYLSRVNSTAENLRKYLITNWDDADADLWGPLMLTLYRNQEKGGALDEAAQAHRAEVMEKCIADGCFTAAYPLPDELQKNASEISHRLNAEGTLTEKIEIASAAAEAVRGEISGYDAGTKMLALAEKYPQNMNLQLAAGFIVSQNTRDGGEPNYERAAKALRNYETLWEEAFGADAEPAERAKMQRSLADMMQDMGLTADAIPLFEAAYAELPDDFEIAQSLAYCYAEEGETAKGYELSKELYMMHANNPTVIWSCCVGALKQGEAVEAVGAASKLADLVKNDLGDNADSRDELLFNLVLYLALNDSPDWTDYQYRVYNGDDDTDETVLEELKRNEFLYDYVRAVWYEKQKRNPEEALPFAKKALAAQENSGRLWFLKGITALDCRQTGEAVEALKQADILENDDPSIQFAYANALDAAGDYELALEYCDKALAHYPNGVDHSYDFYGVSGHVGALRNSLLKHLEG